MPQIQKIEKFSEEGKEGRKVSFRFTTQNNLNGVAFNPLSVFTPEAVGQAKYDYNHDFNYERFSADSNSMTLGEPKIEGTKIMYEAEYKTTDPEAVKVVDSEKFSGFSSNLIPVKDPIPNRKATPRYYEDGSLQFASWTLLEGQRPAFEGAGDIQVEQFSVAEDVVLMETFAEEEEPKEEPKEEQPTEDKPQEEPKPETEEKTQTEEFAVAVKELTETVKELRAFVTEKFSEDETETEDKTKEQKNKEMIERFDANQAKAKEMAKAGKTEKFTKEDPVGNDQTDEAVLAKVSKKLRFK